MIDLDDDVKEFLTQVYEDIEILDRNLVELEKMPTNEELLAQIFRSFHTIKGDCGFFGFSKLGKLVHASENLLSRIREGELQIHPEIITVLLMVLDAVRKILHQIETTAQEGQEDYSALKERLTQMKEGKLVSAESVQIEISSEVSNLSEFNTENADDSNTSINKLNSKNVEIADELPPSSTSNNFEPDFKKKAVEELEEKVEAFPSLENKLEKTEVETPYDDQISYFEKKKEGEISSDEVNPESSIISDSNIRVDVRQLDKLMTLVGELVLTRNQILQYTSNQEHTGLVGASQRLNLITSELQEGIMKTRMQPIKKLWDKFPRLVRDVSMACGKKIHLQMEGEETELDKTLIETISDPITHLVRNAIDHGIESPPERLAKGKTEAGQLLVRAYHESGKVNIEVSDDGAGFDLQRLLEKALQRGFITKEQGQHLSEREIFDLVFLPGFSTAKQVSDISGRGVGLDVVKTNMEQIGGIIDLQSTLNKGTSFKFKLPLTLAIIPALIVKNLGDNYAIPQVNLVELVRLKGEQHNSIELIHDTPVYRLRGKLLPLVYLSRELKLDNECFTTASASAPTEKSISIVVLQADERHFGLVVDEVNDTQEIVVKPLGKQLKGLTLYAGATILGNGNVALILDVMALSQNALKIADIQKHSQRRQNLTDSSVTDKTSQQLGGNATQPIVAEERETFLIIQNDNSTRMAIPLSLVTRLEKFPRNKVESAGNQYVIQYREQILPLIYLSTIFDVFQNTIDNSLVREDDMLQVVVYSTPNRSVGFVVPRIVDIVEENITVKNHPSRQGVLYSTVIQGCVTELLDVESIIQTVSPT